MTHHKEFITTTCDKCGDQVQLHYLTPKYICSCGRASNAANASHPAYQERAVICNDCRYRTSKGCSLLPKQCRIRLIWAEEMEPPAQCPKFEQLKLEL